MVASQLIRNVCSAFVSFQNTRFQTTTRWQKGSHSILLVHDPTRGETIPLVRTVLRYTKKKLYAVLKRYRKTHAPDMQRVRLIGCDFFVRFRGFPVQVLHSPDIGKRSYLLARGPYEQIICASPTTVVSPCCRCTCHNRVLEYPPDFLERSKSSS